MESTILEQRSSVRSDIAWPVSVWMPEANRFFNGKSVNVSKGGALISLPFTAPVREGHEIEVNFPRTTSLARQKGQYARIKNGRVIRVDRNQLLNDRSIGIAVQFS